MWQAARRLNSKQSSKVEFMELTGIKWKHGIKEVLYLWELTLKKKRKNEKNVSTLVHQLGKSIM